MNKSLGQRISEAKNETEITGLLREGFYYDNASQVTIRRWHRLAQRRRFELS